MDTEAAKKRFHWPEYLMEAAEAGLYLFSACVFATLLWHPASHCDRPFTVGQTIRSALQPRGHIHVLSIEENGVAGRGNVLCRAIRGSGRRRGARHPGPSGRT